MPKNKDGYYRGSFVIGKKPDGSPDRVTVRAKTKKEFDEKMSEAKRLYARGLALGNMTVCEWSERWIKVYKANVGETQKDHYRAKLNLDILPAIGNMRIKDVRASHLQELLNSYVGQKKGTVQKIRVALRQLFGDAENEGIIERNPASRLELPELSEVVRRPLTVIERKTVLKVAEEHPRGPYVLTMLYCGLRRGECLALTAGDVDIENKKIIVNRSLSLRKSVGKIKGTKSAAGMREVPIPDLLLPTLVSLCEGRDDNSILFPKSDGKHATKQTCVWWWNSFQRQCHIEAGAKLYRNKILTDTSPFDDSITPHYLRHTYATDLYAADVDEKARKAFLGHASKDVTDIYTKMSDAAFKRAATLLNEFYNLKKWDMTP